jgi:hypothetical protein
VHKQKKTNRCFKNICLQDVNYVNIGIKFNIKKDDKIVISESFLFCTVPVYRDQWVSEPELHRSMPLAPAPQKC